MFKKFIVLAMMVCLFVSQADAATHNGLKLAFDDLNYALTVDWDQKDQTFYKQQMDKFASEVKVLEAEGMSKQELIDFTLANVKDQNLARDLETVFNMIEINKMSAPEANRYVTDFMKDSYNRGASWNGSPVAGAIVIVLLIAVAAIIAGKAKVGEGCYEVYTCEDECYLGYCQERCEYRCVN